MTGPLTYPPETVIESSIELPPEFDVPRGISFEAQVEQTMLVIELVVGLFEGLLS